jgi:hypothetical protein
MSEAKHTPQQLPETLPINEPALAYIIRHRFRPGVYLGRDGNVRNVPLLFAVVGDGWRVVNGLDPLWAPDWTVVAVAIQEL